MIQKIDVLMLKPMVSSESLEKVIKHAVGYILTQDAEASDDSKLNQTKLDCSDFFREI